MWQLDPVKVRIFFFFLGKRYGTHSCRGSFHSQLLVLVKKPMTAKDAVWAENQSNHCSDAWLNTFRILSNSTKVARNNIPEYIEANSRYELTHLELPKPGHGEPLVPHILVFPLH